MVFSERGIKGSISWVASETGSLPDVRHTYYKLFEMLTQNVELTSLNPRRKIHFNQKRIEAVGQMLGFGVIL